MLNSLAQKMEKCGTLQFIMLFTLLSEILTVFMNAVLGMVFWGEISLSLLYIGAIDALIVGLTVSSVGVYIIRKITHLKTTNEQLLREIQARERVEDSYRESIGQLADEKKKTEEIIDAIGDAISIQDRNFKVLYQNRLHRELLGEHAGEFCYKAYQNNDHVCAECHTAKAFIDSKIHRAERKRTTPQGTTYFEITAAPLTDSRGNVIAGIEAVRDITERRKAESQLRLSGEIIANMEEGVFLISASDSSIVYANPAAEKMFGYSSGELIGKHAEAVIAGKDRSPQETVGEIVRHLAEEGVFRGELANVRKDGRTIWCHAAFSTFEHHEYGPVWISIHKDITERKHTAEALKKSEALLQAIIDTEPECVKLTDSYGHLLMMNRAGLAMIQADSLDQVMGTCVCSLVAGEHLEAFERLLKRVFTGESGTLAFEMQGLKGRTLWLETHAVPFRNERNKIVAMLGVTRDITEKKKLEDDLLRAQKLESLGVLAGGLAHDFNNLLMGIMGNISFAKMYVEETGKAHNRLEEAEKASERARELTQQLLTFSSGGQPVREVASVEKVVREMASFALRGSDVACRISVADGIWSAYMDSGQISQVINNIILNAKQAMPEGGSLVISCENIVADPGGPPAISGGKYIRITLADSGIGIRKEHLARVFDPYFTTKQQGRGLGLASCYSIMKRHDGHIEVDSEPGRGSTFTLYLPAREDRPVERSPWEIKTPPRKGRILVMDDEEMVRDITGEMLKKLGYSVRCAKEGREAVEIFEAARAVGEPFDAVIMDLTVPGGMGGREAMRELRKIDPDVKAIVSSGYANDPVTANCGEYGFIASLAKPYRIIDLGRVVEEALSSG